VHFFGIPFVTQTDVCSVLKMRWFIGGRTKIRELELATMEQGNLLL
jgi:hypothetical protein